MIDNLVVEIKPTEDEILGKIFQMLRREKIIPESVFEKDS